MTQTGSEPRNTSNRLGLDYTTEARGFPALSTPIIDVHTHINGEQATRVYKRAADLYGINQVYSMTRFEEAERVREIMESRIRFIAVPNYWAEEDRKYHMGEGFLKRIEEYHALGSRIVKFWAAPRARDYADEMGDPRFMHLDAPHRIAAMELGSDLGMYFMAHIADPDTWFQAKYTDADKYGTKAQQYEPFEVLLDRFRQPWIAAHMGGWPEDLAFLDGLLGRHDNLYLDTSACKWMVRELSRHSRDDLLHFLRRWRGRILFGSDIVSAEEHLSSGIADTEMSRKAASETEAFDLYASRYWALRTMFETNYDGPSPITDPDLAMVEPDRYGELDAPMLRGQSLPADVLRDLYHDAAHELLEPLHATA